MIVTGTTNFKRLGSDQVLNSDALQPLSDLTIVVPAGSFVVFEFFLYVLVDDPAASFKMQIDSIGAGAVPFGVYYPSGVMPNYAGNIYSDVSVGVPFNMVFAAAAYFPVLVKGTIEGAGAEVGVSVAQAVTTPAGPTIVLAQSFVEWRVAVQ